MDRGPCAGSAQGLKVPVPPWHFLHWQVALLSPPKGQPVHGLEMGGGDGGEGTQVPTSSFYTRGPFSLIAFAFPTLCSEDYELSPSSLDK